MEKRLVSPKVDTKDLRMADRGERQSLLKYKVREKCSKSARGRLGESFHGACLQSFPANSGATAGLAAFFIAV